MKLLNIIIILAMVASTLTGCDRVDQAVASFNKAIAVLEDYPGSWESVLMNLIKELGIQADATIEKAANEVERLLQETRQVIASAVHEVGVEIRCNLDMIGNRVRDQLIVIRDVVLLNKTLPPPSPVVCAWVPSDIWVDWDLQKERWVIQKPQIELYGYNFTVDAIKNPDLVTLDIKGQSFKENPSLIARQSTYKLAINLQGLQGLQKLGGASFEGVDNQYKLQISWPGLSKEYYAVNYLIGATRPTSTPIPEPTKEPFRPIPPVTAPPGLVIGLAHTSQGPYVFASPASLSFMTKDPPFGINLPIRLAGGDDGMSPNEGFQWWMVQDYSLSDDKEEKSPFDASLWKLPAGVVLALKHSVNQKDIRITAFNTEPAKGAPQLLLGAFRLEFGGDRGDTDPGEGYYWYESTGANFDWATDRDWANGLPRGTVIGLKHSEQQRDKKLFWAGDWYDPALDGQPPDGYVRRGCYDNRASKGQGFCWYEKTTGVSIVLRTDTKDGELDRALLENIRFSGWGHLETFLVRYDDPQVCQAYCLSRSSCTSWTLCRAQDPSRSYGTCSLFNIWEFGGLEQVADPLCISE